MGCWGVGNSGQGIFGVFLDERWRFDEIRDETGSLEERGSLELEGEGIEGDFEFREFVADDGGDGGGGDELVE